MVIRVLDQIAVDGINSSKVYCKLSLRIHHLIQYIRINSSKVYCKLQ